MKQPSGSVDVQIKRDARDQPWPPMTLPETRGRLKVIPGSNQFTMEVDSKET